LFNEADILSFVNYGGNRPRQRWAIASLGRGGRWIFTILIQVAGTAAFFIFPDATTLLVDAGDMSETIPELCPPEMRHKNRTIPKRPPMDVDYIHQFFQKPYGASWIMV